MASEYKELDKNLLIETEFEEESSCIYHNVREAPFDLYNFYDPKNEACFIRYPSEVVEKVGLPKTIRMSRESSGGKIRFSTDSQYILLKAKEESVARISHAPLAMSAGFDLFEDFDYGSKFIKVFMPPYGFDGEYTQIIRFNSKKKRYFTINFPIRSIVSDVRIGLESDAYLGEGKKYKNEKPIVIYGSSIVHGTAASRPGQTYPNMLSRFLDIEVMNMGLSGSALAEIPIMEYLASLEMSVFIYDYDHNAPTAEYLKETHKRGYDIIRKAHPMLPIILISRPNAATAPNYDDVQSRKAIIYETYRLARESGDKHIYYIDGDSFFNGKFINECTIEGAHPNDIGFMFMEDKIESFVRKALAER